jgi:hypothetical protein
VVNNLSARFESLEEFRARSVRINEGAVLVTAKSSPGRIYMLEYKRGIDQNNWLAATNSVETATGAEVTLTDAEGAGEALRIYRVVERDGEAPAPDQ